MKSKQQLEDEFEWWITCIPDKMYRLEELLPGDLYEKLDYTLASLNHLEAYLLENTSYEQMKSNPELLDCLASYLGATYKRIIEKSEWYIELENEKDAFYGMPILRVPGRLTFEPHSFITTLLDRRKGNFLSTIIKNHIKFLEESKEN